MIREIELAIKALTLAIKKTAKDSEVKTQADFMEIASFSQAIKDLAQARAQILGE